MVCFLKKFREFCGKKSEKYEEKFSVPLADKSNNSTLEEAMKAHGVVQVYLFSLLILSARRECVVKATPRLFYPRERPRTHRIIGGWVGPRSGLEK